MHNRTKSFIALVLLLLMMIEVISCVDQGSTSDTDGVTGSPETLAPDNGDKVSNNATDDLPDINFGGDTFYILTWDDDISHTLHDFTEITNDAISNAKYNIMRNIEARFGVLFQEDVVDKDYINTSYRNILASGDDTYDLLFGNQRFAHIYAEEGLIYKYNDLLYVDLDKDYWDQQLREYTSVCGQAYYAYGAYDTASYEFTHALLFNKDLREELQLEDLYQLVRDGKWTFDKFYEMCQKATYDNDGNDTQDVNDNYGYICGGKELLPNFWIAGGTTTVKLDRDYFPYLSVMDNERLLSIIDRCFEMFWENKVWYISPTEDMQSRNHVQLFSSGRALFGDWSFYYITQLYDMESPFGIIPYPKYSESEEYYSRVEGGDVPIVPITNDDPSRSGIIIEAMACEGYKDLMPVFYESSLKRRSARDEESAEMIDLIFRSRVFDLGDTWYCDQLRDGIMAKIWCSGENTVASKFKANDKMLKKMINDTVIAYLN